MTVGPYVRRVRCRAICTVNQVSRRKGAVHQCEEWVTPPKEGAPLCWTHRKALTNPERKEPLQLSPETSE